MRKIVDWVRHLRDQRRRRIAGIKRKKRLSRRSHWRNLNRTKPTEDRERREAIGASIPRIHSPTILDLRLDPEGALQFVNSLGKALWQSPSRKVVVDLRGCEQLSPDIVILLLAELTKAKSCPTKVRLFCYASRDRLVNEVLSRVGFFDILPSFAERYSHLHFSDRNYSHYETGVLVDSEVVGKMVDSFKGIVWRGREKKRLYEALIECLTNVKGHAYAVKGQVYPGSIQSRWWITSHTDLQRSEIWFCVHDRGVGIPGTIRFKFYDNLPGLGPSDEELIVKAVIDGAYSQTRNPYRGKGLPTLRAFIQEAADGELLIVSGHSMCKFSAEGIFQMRRLKTSLEGTLIVWAMRRKIDERGE